MKLTYFDIRGRGESIRLMLEDSGARYEDAKLSLRDWGSFKPTLPFAQVPALEDDGHLIVQSQAILRHLARKLGLQGRNPDEQTHCDIIQEAIADANRELGVVAGEREKSKRDRHTLEELPHTLQHLERYFTAGRNQPRFWVGDAVTYVDYIAWAYLDVVRAFSSRTLERFSSLSAFKSTFEQRPGVSRYLSSGRRPATIFMPWVAFGGRPEES